MNVVNLENRQSLNQADGHELPETASGSAIVEPQERLHMLERENRQLRKLVAEYLLEIEALRDTLSQDW